MTSSHLDLERRLEDRLPARLRRQIDTIDGAVTSFLERYGITALRIALGVVFIWFGTLKVIGRSPVEDLVKDTIYFLPQDTFFIVIGVWEIIIGIGLLFPVALRLTLALFWLQMAGTFLSLIILPGRALGRKSTPSRCHRRVHHQEPGPHRGRSRNRLDRSTARLTEELARSTSGGRRGLLKALRFCLFLVMHSED